MTGIVLSADLCAACGRPPHAIDDPQCMPATKPIAEQLTWALDEIQRLRASLASRPTALAAVELIVGEPDDTVLTVTTTAGELRRLRAALTSAQAPLAQPDWTWTRNDDAVFFALMLCGGHSVPRDAVTGWTDEECMAAQNWACTEHLAASDNDDVQRLPMPACVKAWPPKPHAAGDVCDLWS